MPSLAEQQTHPNPWQNALWSGPENLQIPGTEPLRNLAFPGTSLCFCVAAAKNWMGSREKTGALVNPLVKRSVQWSQKPANFRDHRTLTKRLALPCVPAWPPQRTGRNPGKRRKFLGKTLRFAVSGICKNPASPASAGAPRHLVFPCVSAWAPQNTLDAEQKTL